MLSAVLAAAVSLVNPFVGTGGTGHMHPAATAPFGMVHCENIPQNVLTVLWWGQPTVREGQVFRMRVAYAFPDPRGDRDVVAASLTTYRRSLEEAHAQEAGPEMISRLQSFKDRLTGRLTIDRRLC